MRFTVRRPPIGEVSPCCHRPSGGDVACSVDVGVAPTSSAGFALENRLALAVPGSDVPARGASLRRVRGRDLLDPTVSLVLQARGEKPPSAAADRPIQPALLSNPHTGLLESSPRSAGHRPHVECFDPDRVEAARKVSGGFLDPVLAPVDLTRFQFRDRPFGSRASVGAALGPGKPLLQHLQPLGLTRGSDWVRAAVRRSTAPPPRQHRGRCRPRCHRAARRSGRGCGRTRHASGRPDHG